MNSVWIDVINRCLMFSVLAVSANLVLGLAGQMSLAAAGFFGTGAYASAIVASDHGWGFFPSTLLAIIVSAAMAALLAMPVLRVKGEYVVLLTLAFLQVVNQMESSWIGLTGGATGKFPIPQPRIFGYDPVKPFDFLWLNGAAVVVVVVVGIAIASSPYGRILKGIREDPRATSAMGANVFPYQLSIFAVSGALAGFAGSLWSHYFAFITPSGFDLNQTIFIAAIVVLGGMGNVWGSVLAAFVLVSLPQALKSLDISADHGSQIQQVVYGLLLIAFMVFRPHGLLRERLGSVPAPGGVAATDALAAAWAAPGIPPAGVAPGGDTEGSVLLRAEHVTKRFGGVVALDDVSIELRAGRITALIGPNGAGKTTLFNVLAGDLKPDAGSVRRGDREIVGKRPDQIVHLGVGRSFQDVRVFAAMSAIDNVAAALRAQVGVNLRQIALHPIATFTGQRTSRARAAALLELVGMSDQRHVRVGDLGYGEQKLVALARLLATDPQVVLLDEPSAGTDSKWVLRVLDIVRQLAASGKAVCIVEHNLDLIRQLDGEAYFLDEGRIVASGTVDHLMADRRLLENYLGLS
jgi:ABC-type branched-subunit amino acid transport system ATPase component/ABC-type branched-subunit amino acid transport system permease subunit